jgi:hypothetical protein
VDNLASLLTPLTRRCRHRDEPTNGLVELVHSVASRSPHRRRGSAEERKRRGSTGCAGHQIDPSAVAVLVGGGFSSGGDQRREDEAAIVLMDDGHGRQWISIVSDVAIGVLSG